MKEGQAAARGLWWGTDLTRIVLRGDAGGHHETQPPHTSGLHTVSEPGRGMHIGNCLLFTSLSLCVSSPSLCGLSTGWAKGAPVSLLQRLALGAAVEVSPGVQMKKVSRTDWNCWHLVSFHCLLWSYVSRRILSIGVGLPSLVFSTRDRLWKYNTRYHANSSLWVICSLFEPIPARSFPLFLEQAQRETLLFRLAEGRSVWVCCDCCLLYSYSFLLQKRKSHVLKIPLMGIKV